MLNQKPLCPLHQNSVRIPANPAIIGPEGIETWAQVEARALRAASALSAQGLLFDDRVAWVDPPSPDALALFAAAWRLGAAISPMSTQLPHGEILRRSRVIHARGLLSTTLKPGSGSGLIHFTLDAPRKAAPPEAHYDPAVPAALIWTSGSSGEPKAAVLTPGNLLANARASNQNLPFTRGDSWLLSLPLWHVSGLGIWMRVLVAGATLVLPEPGRDFAEAIVARHVTHVSLVPTQLIRLLATPQGRDALAQLKAILLGGAPLPPRLLAEADALNLPVYRTYGMTETASQIATARVGEPLRPLVPDNLRIASDGEIQVRGETLFAGYYRKTHPVRHETDDGWFATGDLGRWDDRDGLIVAGRKDRRFASGGENIQPEEIERALLAVQEVTQAVVVPVSDAEYGARPVAFIQAVPGSALTARTLREALEQTLPRFMIPKAFLPWPDGVATGMKPSWEEFQRLADAYRG